MLDYDFYYKNIGNRFDIVEGHMAADPVGPLLASDTPGTNCIYVNNTLKEVTLIADWIGKPYILQKADCISNSLEWRALNGYNNFTDIYRSMKQSRLFYYHSKGVRFAFTDGGLIEYDPSEVTLKQGDVLLYKYDGVNENHSAIFLGDKVLHTLPSLLSCYSEFNPDLVFKVYRDE
jgi:hypothetical protein|tara:strand:- start:220 stop:747 length:528 start_codon:yes stop_codon:yes gene_type:complete